MPLSKPIAALLLFAACGAAAAQNTIVLGSIERVEYFKEGSDFCPVTCPDGLTATKDGRQSVCLSRHGDCELVQLRVVDTLTGAGAGAVVQARSKLGEFNRPVVPMASRLVLAELTPDGWATYVSAIYTGGGVLLRPGSWARIGGIDLVSLKNENGNVPLDALRQRLPARP